MTALPAAHRQFAALMEARTGQQLSPARASRIDTALGGLMRELDCPSLDALAGRLMAGDPALATRVVETLLNNETSFFRDRDVFTLFDTQLFPALASARAASRRLDIWSVGCSTGQEPYSLAMQFGEGGVRWRDWTIAITGTDVSAAAIERARAGRYTRFEIQRGLPVRAMLRWFSEVGDEWHAVPALRRAARFQQHSLFDRPVGRFDLILCRNVLMYFAAGDRRRAFDRLADALAPDGYLVLGAGETVLGQTDRFEPHPTLRGLYRRTTAIAAAA